MCNISKILPWDSSFFGLKIASIVITEFDECYIWKEVNRYKDENYDLLYLLINEEIDIGISALLENHLSIILVDQKRLYSTSLDMIVPYSSNKEIIEFKSSPSLLYDLSIQSGHESRYRRDRNFSNEQFEKLYKVWIENSLSGELADVTFVYKNNDCIYGFVTVKTDGYKASIGLIAIDTNERGKGIGHLLLAAAKKYAKERGVSEMEVATQTINQNACRFYEKNDFILKTTTNIYHIWLKKQ